MNKCPQNKKVAEVAVFHCRKSADLMLETRTRMQVFEAKVRLSPKLTKGDLPGIAI
jgi:hypothetical protein